MNYLKDIPEAPWIMELDSGKYEDPDSVTIYCPVCGAENPDIVYLDDRDEVCGCEFCLRQAVAWDVLHRTA